MEFIISRTSSYRDLETPPTEGAFLKTVPKYDIRTCSVEYFDEQLAAKYGHKKWLDEGSEHCVNAEGYISRRTGDEQVWALEVKDLQQIVELSQKEGSLVINPNSIEIYDTYRE